MNWLKHLLPKKARAISREEQLNHGLHLAMEWGEDWLQPIQPRLAKAYPQLSSGARDEINAICQRAMKLGNKATYELSVKLGKEVSARELAPIVRAEFPWIDDRNMARLFSQGMYYAWKDGAVA